MKYMNAPYGKRDMLSEDYVIATFLLYGLTPENVMDRLGNFAIGQTVGTWVKVPGITQEMVEKYQARVIEAEMTRGEPDYEFMTKVAFPVDNFGGSFAAMLTGILGNDVSTSLRIRLINMEFTGNSVRKMGYRKRKTTPIEKLRKITGVFERPLVLNMIKPCIGFSAETGAEYFKESAQGGIDLIKDDELLTNPEYCQVEERFSLYERASDEVYEQTGKKTIYIPDVTDRPYKMRKHIESILQKGAKACMVNYVFTGLDAFAEICKEYGEELFIMGHYAGIGVMNGEQSGIKNSVYLGILPRLAGADSIMTMFQGNASESEKLDYYQTVQQQMCASREMDKIVTAVGGGINPCQIPGIIEELGNDIIIGVGGAIQGHPMGTTEGAKAVMKAVTSAAQRENLETAAKDCRALKTALELWGGK